MAHMIENNEIAYKGAQPWHGLGVAVPENATGAEMLKAAGLEWEVQMRELAFMLPGQSGDLVNSLARYRAVTRSDNDKVFQVATPIYQPVQNAEIVDFFKEYCEAGLATMETVGALKGGAIVWALARLNAEANKTIKGGDELRGYMLLATSHDGSMQTLGRATQVRVVCWNTLSAALAETQKSRAQFKMMHLKKWNPEIAAQAREQLGMAAHMIAQTNAIAEALAKVKIDSDGWLEFATGLLGSKDEVIDAKKGILTRTAQAIKDATLTSPGADLKSAKGTLWGAVNGVTYFADHDRGMTQDTRMAGAWFGDGERMKNDALAVAMQMAGIPAPAALAAAAL